MAKKIDAVTPTAAHTTSQSRPVLTGSGHMRQTERSHRMLWTSVAVVMLIIIAGWAALLRTTLTHGSNTEGLFTSISDQLKRVFTDDAALMPAVLGDSEPAAQSDTKLQELRGRVFPELSALEQQNNESK